MARNDIIRKKINESVSSVLPIAVVVSVLCLFFVPVTSGLLLSFLIGSLMLIIGMALFTLGAEMSMTQIGNHIGAKMTQSKSPALIFIVSLILGIAVTIAEPDLQVLATNVPGIDTKVLMLVVSVGVGLFLTLAMARALFSIPLRALLLIFYIAIFALAAFADPDFLSVAFDSGGVTTGPMTTPFIMALGVGVTSIRSDGKAKSDAFGLVALCSIGPILSVLILGFIYNESAAAESAVSSAANFEISVELGRGYIAAFPTYLKDVAVALIPIFLFFAVFQIFSLRLRKILLLRILIGIAYTYVGLTLFLTGVNVGFSPLGYALGGSIAVGPAKFLLIPLAALIGWFIINAEPSVHVLNKQVEELSVGAISEKAMGLSLSIAIAVAMALAMIRVLTGISILWFMVPGYAAALLLTFFVPETFTAIAFDSGGVASGPLTAAFMLPLAMGATAALGGNIMTDAFGLVAMVAMTPLITVQIMGVVYVLKSRRPSAETAIPEYMDDAVVELWETT